MKPLPPSRQRAGAAQRRSRICGQWTVLLTLGLLAGCQQLGRQQADGTMTALHEDLSTLTGAVVSTQASVAEMDERAAARDATLSTELETLKRRLAGLPRQLENLCPPASTESDAAQCEERPTIINDQGRLLLGGLEEVWLDPPGVTMVARMDTGADSSSVNAQNLQEFERDGDDWVRFDWVIRDNVYTVERPIERYVRVIQQADPEGTRRPVVALRLKIGTTDDRFEFTLADRSHLEYQMILGRNFLTNVAVVDVGQQFVQPRAEPTSP
ncbi:MAG: RimK/LysX family protein [Pseudomonadota bacterium]